MYKALAVRLRTPGDTRFLLGLASLLRVTGVLLVLMRNGMGLARLKTGLPAEAAMCLRDRGVLLGAEALRELEGLGEGTAVLLEGLAADAAPLRGAEIQAPLRAERVAAGPENLAAWSREIFEPVHMATLLLHARFIGVLRYRSVGDLVDDLSALSSRASPDHVYVRATCSGGSAKLVLSRGRLVAAMSEAVEPPLYGAEAVASLEGCSPIEAYAYRVPRGALPLLSPPSCGEPEECIKTSVAGILEYMGVEAGIGVKEKKGILLVEIEVLGPPAAKDPGVRDALEAVIREAAVNAALSVAGGSPEIRVSVRAGGKRPNNGSQQG